MDFVYGVIDRIFSHMDLGSFLILSFLTFAFIFTTIISYKSSIKKYEEKI